MKKFIVFILILAFISLKPALSQQAYKLTVKQPPALTITLSETINAAIGEVVNLDTYFNVEGDNSFIRQWKFRSGSQLQTIDNPLFKITGDGVFYLTVTNAYGCSVLDSIDLNVVTGIEDLQNRENPQSIRVYPNPNAGTFDITISDCQPGFSIEIINSLGVRFLTKPLECNNNEYSGKIMMPAGESGTYYLLVKRDSRILFKQKVIILK